VNTLEEMNTILDHCFGTREKINL
jgi:hypothetical protein